MPRKLFKRYLPSATQLEKRGGMNVFAHRFVEPDLWHLNRRSVSIAMAVGLFLAFQPIPGQVILAALVALWLRCNLPLSVVMVWVTNPVTMPPVYYFNYKVGTVVLQVPPLVGRFELSMDWISQRMADIWLPLVIGSLLVGVVAAAAGWAGMQGFWRWHVVQQWQRRRELRRLRALRQA